METKNKIGFTAKEDSLTDILSDSPGKSGKVWEKDELARKTEFENYINDFMKDNMVDYYNLVQRHQNVKADMANVAGQILSLQRQYEDVIARQYAPRKKDIKILKDKGGKPYGLRGDDNVYPERLTDQLFLTSYDEKMKELNDQMGKISSGFIRSLFEFQKKQFAK